MKDTKEKEESPVLVGEVIGLVKKCEGNDKQQRVFNRVMALVMALVMAELFAFGRHTITQLLLTLGLTDEDWSSWPRRWACGWYRIFSLGRYAETETSRVMLEEVEEEEPFVVGGDGFHVPRCSEQMPGTAPRGHPMRGLTTAKWRPGIQRGQRYVETSWLTPLKNGFSRAIPLRCLPAFTEKSVPCEGVAPRTEVATGLVILKWLRGIMDKAGRIKQWLVALYDGSPTTCAA